MLTEEGLQSFLKKSKNYLFELSAKSIPDPMYRMMLPEFITLRLDGMTAKFHSDLVSLSYDFRDDFETEKHVISEFVRDVRRDDIVYDIGANGCPEPERRRGVTPTCFGEM